MGVTKLILNFEHLKPKLGAFITSCAFTMVTFCVKKMTQKFTMFTCHLAFYDSSVKWKSVVYR